MVGGREGGDRENVEWIDDSWLQARTRTPRVGGQAGSVDAAWDRYMIQSGRRKLRKRVLPPFSKESKVVSGA